MRSNASLISSSGNSVGHDAVIADPAGLGEAHQPRDVARGLALPALRALQDFVEVKRQRVELDLLMGTPTRMQRPFLAVI